VNDNTVLRADSGGNMPSPPDPATMGNIPNGTGAST
jgi:hypothetical protein